MSNRRPRLRRPLAVWLIFAGSCAALIAGGLGLVAAILCGTLLVVMGGAWLISPWSSAARNLIMPDRTSFDRETARGQRVADSIGRIPIFGRVWRLAQRRSKPMLDDLVQRQRELIDEEAKRHPNEST